jgi:hypothetical protein
MSTKKNSTKATKNSNSTTEQNSPLPQDIASAAVLAVVTAASTTCETVLGGLKDGEKVSMDSLTSAVAGMTGLKQDKVYPFVSLYLKSRPGVTIATGRQGGVYRGAPPAKAIDPEQAARLVKKLARFEAQAAAANKKAEELRTRIPTTTTAPEAPAAS